MYLDAPWWRILCDSKHVGALLNIFLILIVSTYYILCISWIIKCLIINIHLQTLLLANVLGKWKIDTTPKAKKVKKGKQKALRSVRNDIASCQEDGDSGVPPNVGNVLQTRHATEHFNTSFNKLLTAAYFCTSLQSHRK